MLERTDNRLFLAVSVNGPPTLFDSGAEMTIIDDDFAGCVAESAAGAPARLRRAA